MRSRPRRGATITAGRPALTVPIHPPYRPHYGISFPRPLRFETLRWARVFQRSRDTERCIRRASLAPLGGVQRLAALGQRDAQAPALRRRRLAAGHGRAGGPLAGVERGVPRAGDPPADR